MWQLFLVPLSLAPQSSKSLKRSPNVFWPQIAHLKESAVLLRIVNELCLFTQIELIPVWINFTSHDGPFVLYPAEAYFSKVPKRFGPISGATIPFISSQRRALKPSNLAFLLVFLTLKTC